MPSEIAMRRLIPWVIGIAMLIDTLDSTIVSVAIPSIAQSFNINPIDLKIALTSYLLSLAVFIPISGWLADKYRAKRIFVLAMLVFTLSSALCASATNLPYLVVARMLQGFGGALMMPVGRLIILRVFPRSEFATAMQLVVLLGLIGPVMGPTVGGIILHFATWHWIFLVNIPFGIIGLILSIMLIPSIAPQPVFSFSWLEFLLFSVGLSCVTFAMALLGDSFDLLNIALILGAIGCSFLIIFWRVSLHHPHSLIDVKLFKQKTFGITMIVSLLVRPLTGAVPFIVALLLQLIWGHTPLYSGFAFGFVALGMMCARFAFKQRIFVSLTFRQALILIVALLILFSVGLCWFSVPRSFVTLILVLFCYGMVLSQLYMSLGVLAVFEMTPEQYSQVTSISATIQQFSMGFGIALTAIVMHLLSRLLQQPVFS
jgi:EmrB/QacA subfamily drug resistance transporter